MKFQDDISNMNTYIRTYIHTDKPKPICPPLFQSWGHKNASGSILQHIYMYILVGHSVLNACLLNTLANRRIGYKCMNKLIV